MRQIGIITKLYFCQLFVCHLFANGDIHSLNDKKLQMSEIKDSYTFVMAGHIYGSHNSSIYPSASLLANMNIFSEKDIEFMVLLGDIFQRSNEVEIQQLKETFLNNLDYPVFNSAGNHDLEDRELYVKHFGKTYFSFEISSELFVFLDSEENNGKIMDDQLEFIKNRIQIFESKMNIKNMFIFSHRLLWAIGNPPFDKIIDWVNGPAWHPEDALTVSELIIPLLKRIKDKRVYFVSGDIGAGAFTIFYQNDINSNVTYLATGLGDHENDVVIKVRLDRDRNVLFSPISLSGKRMELIQNYDLNYWQGILGHSTSIPIKFHQRLLNILLSKYFIIGSIFGSVGLLFCITLFKRFIIY